MAERTFKVERERTKFLQLIAANPNYFGNFSDAPFKVVKKIIGNTTYEEATCVGFNPRLDTLEATVEIKRPTGYLGDLCVGGSTEYVRFYVDYGAGWEDMGVVSFKAHDIPTTTDCAKKSTKPLNYVLTQEIEPKRRRCKKPLLPKVRAILSWQIEPPAGNPNWPPVWGNVLERHIQIRPRPNLFLDLPEMFGGKIVKLPPEFEEVQFEPIPLPDPPPFQFKELASLYGGSSNAGKGAKAKVKTSVEPHRFGMQQIQAVTKLAAVNQESLLAEIASWKDLGLNWQNAVTALEETQGNVSYEELHCLGLDCNLEWAVATFVVKKPTGYSGNLCEKGSKEYVAFWVDWDDECDWTYLGTVSVEAHDIASIPPGGLHYAAILPVQLDPHRRDCKRPKIARVRAVLSWNTPPSTVDEDDIPHWGNRLDIHALIKPGKPGSELEPNLKIIGGISTAQIDVAGNGMTTSMSVFAGGGGFADPSDPSRFCPFGGRITIQASIPAGLSAAGRQYRILSRKQGSALETPVTDKFLTADGVNPPVVRNPDPVTGMVSYLHPNLNLFNYLGWWEAAGLGNELWELRVEMYSAANVLLGSTPWFRVLLDNMKPEVAITMDGGDCEEHTPGTVVSGRFVSRDIHFGRYSLRTLPTSALPNAPVPSSGIVQTSPSPGDVWTLNTLGMKPCGYVIELDVWDRTIVGSLPGSGHHNHDRRDLGFCLIEE